MDFIINGRRNIAQVAAYPIKAECGGGYRGVYMLRGRKDSRVQSERFETLDQARYWAKRAACDRHSNDPGYSLAYIRRTGGYLSNVWVNA